MSKFSDPMSNDVCARVVDGMMRILRTNAGMAHAWNNMDGHDIGSMERSLYEEVRRHIEPLDAALTDIQRADNAISAALLNLQAAMQPDLFASDTPAMVKGE